jgi:hypothetical protein
MRDSTLAVEARPEAAATTRKGLCGFRERDVLPKLARLPAAA